MILYVDILIILNTLVNYFILLAVDKILRIHSKKWRILLGGAVGGISSLLIFFENLGVIMTLLKILTAILMVIATFGIKPIKRLLKSTFLLFAITFLFGGLIFAIYIFFDKDILIYSNGIVYFDISLSFLIICTVIFYVVITLTSKIIDKKAPKSKEYYVTVENAGKTISCTAFMDTGNNLLEPFSGYPVIMIDSVLFYKLFNEEKIRLIPVSTVNGESLIKAFRPEKITINKLITDKVYLGESLSKLDEYKMILNINIEGDLYND
ncbi:MAG: sigma-E processing peptidase SpoIIGA [Clostridia bacterium]|nr:sigma-E processing peptidase SpoIIGA [Clostridia bacterium]